MTVSHAGICVGENLTNQALGEQNGKRAKPPTVREVMDEKILGARKNLERLCIAKAKAETLQLLDAPYGDLCDILY